MSIFENINLDSLPRLYKQDYARKEPTVHLVVSLSKGGNFVWLLTEYCPKEEIFFGFGCIGDLQNAELGYISKAEIEEVAELYKFNIEKVKLKMSEAKKKYLDL